MSIGERIKILRQNLNMTVKDMSDVIGVPVRTIGAYERDENPPNEKFLTLLLEKFNVNINWLLIGKGTLFMQKQDDIADFISTEYNISKQDAINIIKLIENEYTREFILRFVKARSGDSASVDVLMQNIAGMKAIFS